MARRYHTVHRDLSDYVRTVLVLDPIEGNDPEELPLFTNGVPAMVCRIAAGQHRLVLFGQSVPAGYLTTNDVFIIFFFQPFALGPLFKLSARELKTGAVEIDRWSPQRSLALNLQLAHAGSLQEKIEVLSGFVLSQANVNIREYNIVRYATDQLLQDPRAQLLAGLHKELNLTERTFQRIFKKYVGIAANEYRRICQFQMAFFKLKGGHYNKLADIAYDHGYFDQSHYIRSFKEFVNTTPIEYLQFGLRNQ